MERELRFVVRFRNAASKNIKEFNRGLKGMTKDATAAAAAAKAVGTGAKAGAAGAKVAAASVKRSGASMAASMSRARTATFGLQAALLTLGLGVGFGVTISVLKDFEFEMSRIQAITGATELEFAALNATARELGGRTVFKARDVAQGLRLLSQAGFEANEAMAAIAGSLNLAIAGALDLGQATDITANVIRGFSLDAAEAGRVADVLAATASKSNTTVGLLGEALKFVAPVAAATNQSLEGVAAAIGTLSDAGLKGTLAGTGLRRVLVGLVNVTPKAEKAIKRMGLTVAELDPRANSLSSILQKLKGATFGASEAFEIFGLRGGPASLVLTQLADRFETLKDITEGSAGAAQEMADIMRDNLAGDLKIAQSAFEELILTQGAFSDGLREIIQNITGTLQALNGSIDPLSENADKFNEAAASIRTFVKILKGLGILLAGGFIVKSIAALVAGVGTIITAFTAAGGIAAGLGAALAAVGAVLLPLAALVAAAGLAWVIFTDQADAANESIVRLDESLAQEAEFLTKIANIDGQPLVNLQQDIERRTTSLRKEIQKVLNEMTGLQTRIDDLRSGKETLGFFDTLLSGGVLGKINELQGEVDELRGAAERSGEALLGLRKKGLEAAATAKQMAELKQSIKDVQEAATAAGEELKEVLTQGIEAGQKAIEKAEFRVQQLRLGAGVEADLQRDINKRLDKAGLTVSLTPEIQAKASNLQATVDAQRKLLQESGLTELDRDTIQKIIDINEGALESLGRTIEQRRTLKAELIETIKIERQLTAENKAQEALDKGREKAIADVKILNESFASQTRELESGVKVRRNEQRVLDAINKNKAKGIDITGIEITQLRERAKVLDTRQAEKELLTFIENRTRGLREQAEAVGLTSKQQERLALTQELINEAEKLNLVISPEFIAALNKKLDVIDALTKKNETFAAGLRGALAEAIEEGANAAKFGASVMETSLGGAFSAIDQFIETGKLNFKSFATSLIQDIAKLSIRLLIFKALQASVNSGSGGGGILSSVLGAVAGAGGAAGGVPAGARGGRVTDFPKVKLFGHGGRVGPALKGPGLGKLGRDRIPALLSPGELVLTPNQQRQMQARQGGEVGGIVQNINVEIITPDRESFRENEGQTAANLSRQLGVAGKRNN